MPERPLTEIGERRTACARPFRAAVAALHRWSEQRRTCGTTPAAPEPAAPPLDALAKRLAQSVSRREALRRLGAGLGGALLASLGARSASAQPDDRCDCCRFCDALPPGPPRARCLQDARGGFGICFECDGSIRRLCQAGAGNFFCCPVDQRCDNGQCVPDLCPPGYSRCVETCCAPGEFCFGGACHPCPRGQSRCGKSCCSLAQECCEGICCEPGLVCTGGVCVPPCPEGQTFCGTACVDTSSDPSNCGACGNFCFFGQSCLEGECFPSFGGATCCPGDFALGQLGALKELCEHWDRPFPCNVCDLFGLFPWCSLCVRLSLGVPGQPPLCIYEAGSTCDQPLTCLQVVELPGSGFPG